jgi:alpha-galactosidase
MRRTVIASAAAALVALALAVGGGTANAQSSGSIFLAATPYMGWDTYFALPGGFPESTILEEADRLKTSGLEKLGYRLIWLDAGWWQGQRNAAGDVVVNPKQWPHGIAWLASTLHQNGFQLGVYTDAGSTGCGVKGGMYGHYQQDVNTFAAWGVDAIKVDWCGGAAQGLDPATQYAQIHAAIANNASHRPMLLDICNFLQPGQGPTAPTFALSAFSSYTFGPAAGNSWRTDTDIGVPGDVPFNSVLRNLDADATAPATAGPGHWNDPDYLAPDQGMNATQFRSQFSMWAMLAAPLMISDDMLTMSRSSLSTVSNKGIIAIDQDPAGVQGWQIPGSVAGNGEAFEKPLSDGSYAIALLNRGATAQTIATSAASANMPPAASYKVLNVWSGQRSSTTGVISATVPAYATVVVRVSPAH